MAAGASRNRRRRSCGAGVGNEGKGGRHGTVPGWKRSAWAESPASSDRDHADAPSELAIVQIVVSGQSRSKSAIIIWLKIELAM